MPLTSEEIKLTIKTAIYECLDNYSKEHLEVHNKQDEKIDQLRQAYWGMLGVGGFLSLLGVFFGIWEVMRVAH